MVIVGLKRLILSLVLIIAVTMIVIVMGISLNEGEAWSLKLDYQNFFFWGITALIVQLWAGLSLITRHRRILNTVRRLSSIEDLESVYAEKLFHEIGALGIEVKNVLRHSSELSGLRVARISALNSLTEILCEGYSDSILVTDVRGEILSMSDKLKARLAKESGRPEVRNIIDIRADLKLSEVLVFMEKQRSAWSNPDGSGLTCTPVYDRNGKIQFCLWEFETSIFTGKLKDNTQQKYDLRRSYGKIRNILKPRIPGRRHQSDPVSQNNWAPDMIVFFALMSALAYGTADFLGGFSSRRNAASTTVAWSQTAGLITVTAAALIMGSDAVGFADILWGIAGGVSGALGVMILFNGLSSGYASIVSPVAALSGAVLPVVFGFITGERPPLLTWTGVALSLPAILLLSMTREEKKDHIFRSVRLGLVSGALFGGFFIFISRTSEGSGMWPLAAARLVTIPLFLSLSVLRGRKIILARGTRRATLFSGALDMAANVLYLLAARTGYLILAVVLAALYPAPTVVLQKIILHEKLTVARIAGLILSIAGAALIGVGG